MQVYRVEVADRETGKSEVIAVKAASAADAARIANERGWLVGSVSDVPPPVSIAAPIPIGPSPERTPVEGFDTPRSKPKRSVSTSLSRIVGALLIVFAAMTMLLHTRNYEAESAFHTMRFQNHSFKDDFAPGAAANATLDILRDVDSLEHTIRDESTSLHAELLFIGGIIVLVIARKEV